MGILNRSAVILRPRRPYLEWASSHGDREVAELTFDDLRDDPHVYLLPEVEDDQEPDVVLEAVWADLFEHELESWVMDEELWPQGRTYDMFCDWFEIQLCSMVDDRGTAELEELEDE